MLKLYRTGQLLLAAFCMLALGACQTTPDEVEVYDPEKQGVAERVRHYQGAIATSPNDGELYYRLGNALLDMGRHRDAYIAYQKAVQLQPDHAKAFANLGLALRKMGSLKAAMGAYVQALEIDPQDRVTLYNLATVAELTEDWERMKWCYAKLSALEPENLEYCGAYAALLYGLGEFEAAVPVYEKLVAADREPDANNYRLGFCYFSLERWEQAIAAWERARVLVPDNPPVNRGLVAAYIAAGKGAQARAAADRCAALGIALDPVVQRDLDQLAPPLP